jgi:hypothetical protein
MTTPQSQAGFYRAARNFPSFRPFRLSQIKINIRRLLVPKILLPNKLVLFFLTQILLWNFFRRLGGRGLPIALIVQRYGLCVASFGVWLAALLFRWRKEYPLCATAN